MIVNIFPTQKNNGLKRIRMVKNRILIARLFLTHLVFRKV